MTTDPLSESRSYWDRQPCNIRHSTSEVGTKAFFDEIEARKYFVEPHIPGFAQFDRWKGKRVLEIGCGIGTDAVSFCKAGATYTGIDFSEVSLELTRKRLEVYGLKGRLYLGNAEEITKIIPPQTFDLVYSFGVIHHCHNPYRLVNTVQAYLGKKSVFKLMLYASNSWKVITSGLNRTEAQDGCPIVQAFTAEQVYELLDDFDMIELNQDHIFPYVVEKYVQHQYVWEPWFTAMPHEMFRSLEKALGWHLLITCRKRSE